MSLLCFACGVHYPSNYRSGSMDAVLRQQPDDDLVPELGGQQ